MVKETITITEIFECFNGWSFEVDWSGCPNLIYYENEDWFEVAKTREIIEKRLDNYLKGKSNGCRFSDLCSFIKK